jgi:hypothetical protein
MTPTNRLSHNVFRTVAYTKKKWLRSNFFDRNILKTLMSLMTYLSRYRCRYLCTYSIRVAKFNVHIVSTTIVNSYYNIELKNLSK